MEFRKYPRRWFRHLLGVPFIYAVILPIVFLDIVVELYHRVCFPLYGLPYVKRGAYIRIDRHKLSYLDPLEKINCMYCGYVNGFLAYASKIAGDTEVYWCGIQHEQKNGFTHQPHQQQFLPYGDDAALRAFSRRDIPEQE